MSQDSREPFGKLLVGYSLMNRSRQSLRLTCNRAAYSLKINLATPEPDGSEISDDYTPVKLGVHLKGLETMQAGSDVTLQYLRGSKRTTLFEVNDQGRDEDTVLTHLGNKGPSVVSTDPVEESTDGAEESTNPAEESAGG